MAAITFEKVSKVFDNGAKAVDALTLEVPDGQFSVLVGPSGCGKTTALRMIAGLETPSAGRIFLGERDITDLPPRDRDVAMVFQNYALYPHLTVLENITFGLRMRGMAESDANRRAREAATSLGIQDFFDRRPAQLSGGQRQRVALARAIVREPAVFLFDEPLSNLDAQVRAQTRAELVRLQRRLGATVLYVTHDQVEAMTMASRVAVMNGGRLEQVAAPLDIYQRPSSLFVASFVGSPSINRFRGRVERSTQGAHFVGALTVPVGAGDMPSATLAVRPEHLKIGPAEGAVKASVTLVEALGPETLVHLQLDTSETAVVRAAGAHTLPIGAVVPVTVNAANALLYHDSGALAWAGS